MNGNVQTSGGALERLEGWEVLDPAAAARVEGGSIITGSDELARDIGRVLGGAFSLYVAMGAAFYRSGGLTGNNRLLRRDR